MTPSRVSLVGLASLVLSIVMILDVQAQRLPPTQAGSFCCIPEIGGSSCLGSPEYVFEDELACFKNNTNPINTLLGVGIAENRVDRTFPAGRASDKSYAQCSYFCGLEYDFWYCINRDRSPDEDAICIEKSTVTAAGGPVVTQELLEDERGYLRREDCLLGCIPLANTCEGCAQMESIAKQIYTAYSEQFCEQNQKCVWEYNDQGEGECMQKPECSRQYKACCDTSDFTLRVAASDGPDEIPSDISRYTTVEITDPLSRELVSNPEYRSSVEWRPGFSGWTQVNACPGVRLLESTTEIPSLADQCKPQYWACCDPLAKEVYVTELAHGAGEPPSLTPLLEWFFPAMQFVRRDSSPGSNAFYQCVEREYSRWWPEDPVVGAVFDDDAIGSLYDFTLACGVVPREPDPDVPLTCGSCRNCNGGMCFGSQAQSNCERNPRCRWIELNGEVEGETVTLCRARPEHPDCREMPLQCHQCFFSYISQESCNAAPGNVCRWNTERDYCDQNPPVCDPQSVVEPAMMEFNACNRTIGRPPLTGGRCFRYDPRLQSVLVPSGEEIPKTGLLTTHTITFGAISACNERCENVTRFAYCCERSTRDCIFHLADDCRANRVPTFNPRDDGSPAVPNCAERCALL